MKCAFNALLILLLFFCLQACKEPVDPPAPINQAKTETFEFKATGINEGKIYLPGSYDSRTDLPVIYLIDFQEQHHEVARDEFQQVINGVSKLLQVDAAIVSLAVHHDISVQITHSSEYFELFKELAAYVDANYRVGPSKTLIGRGSEGGMVLLSLFQEIGASHGFGNFIAHDPPADFINYVTSLVESDTFPQDKSDMRLHYSFSNDYELAANNLMIDKIQIRNYGWLKFGYDSYPNLSFEEAYPTAYADGIAFILR